ncbi:MAG: hypothetical protein V7L04_02910, partial [Nostoc sp.]
VDNYRGRGRYKAESHLPNLLSDIKNLVDGQSQIDRSFKSQRLYTRLSASVVRHQLIEKFGLTATQDSPSLVMIIIFINCIFYFLEVPKTIHSVHPTFYK